MVVVGHGEGEGGRRGGGGGGAQAQVGTVQVASKDKCVQRERACEGSNAPSYASSAHQSRPDLATSPVPATHAPCLPRRGSRTRARCLDR